MSDERADPWFEDLYAQAGGDARQIPWAHLKPRPVLVDWLDRHPPTAGTRGLVVACGLGDDAEELARRGCVVEAFDLAPTAIAEARRRFPDSTVAYRAADLFALPDEWRQAFGLVVEVQTIQSLPPRWHREAIAVIAGTVAPGGRLLLRAATRGEDEPAPRRPWPLAPSELQWVLDEGLELVERRAEGDGFVFDEYRRPGR